jgi:hypothetical protein
MAQPTPGSSKADRTTRRSDDVGTTERPQCSVGFCPICLAVTTASDLRPEFVEHLMAAGREFLLALRSVIDARLDALERPVKLERLTIE